MTNKPKDGQPQETNWFRDEHGQVTKVMCIIAPTECHNGYWYFQLKKKKKS